VIMARLAGTVGSILARWRGRAGLRGVCRRHAIHVSPSGLVVRCDATVMPTVMPPALKINLAR